jgi:hypothetical protein
MFEASFLLIRELSFAGPLTETVEWMSERQTVSRCITRPKATGVLKTSFSHLENIAS